MRRAPLPESCRRLLHPDPNSIPEAVAHSDFCVGTFGKFNIQTWGWVGTRGFMVATTPASTVSGVRKMTWDVVLHATLARVNP